MVSDTHEEQPSVGQAPTEQAPKKATVRQIISGIIRFTNKHRLALSITAVVICVAVALFSFIPVVSINKLELVNLGASVRLEAGQTVKLKTANVSVEVTHFTNDTCPEVGKCFGSGSSTAVEYALSIDGQKYATSSMLRAASSPYQIETVSSDYKTYAIIKIVKS